MEISILQRSAGFEEVLVHRPEVALASRGFGGKRGGASMRVDLGQGEMPEDKAQGVCKLTLQRIDAVARQPRVRAFIVLELKQRYRGGVLSTLGVVFVGNGCGMVGNKPGHELN